MFYSCIADKQYVSNTVGSKAVALPSKRGRLRGNSKKALSSLTYTGQMGTGGNRAITAAASQAIVDTKQVTLVMRLTASKLFYFRLLIEDNVHHVTS